MPRPLPTPILHFTRIEQLPTILERGLVADSIAQNGLLAVEIGNAGIKDRRRRRTVTCGPGGVVSEYVPFYFAPRSPMMYSIHMGNVPGYDQGCGRILYLVSTVEMVLASGLDLVVSDRNAVLELATFSADAAALDELVDWPLMRQTMWNNTTDEPDRRERRMAEALVHQTLPIDCIVEIAAPTEAIASEVRTMLGKLGIPVRVRPGWYF